MTEITPEQKDALAQIAYDAGYRYQLEKRCCSQTSLAGPFEILGIVSPEVFKAATGLAGGGALCGDAGCGAYIGALMLIGLLKGRPWDNFVVQETSRFKCFEAGQALHRKFISEYGTVICRDIQTNVLGRPFFLSDRDDYEKADALGNQSRVSPHVVRKACRCTVEAIFEQGLLPELNELRRKQPDKWRRIRPLLHCQTDRRLSHHRDPSTLARSRPCALRRARCPLRAVA